MFGPHYHFQQFVDALCARPQMYVGEIRYETVCAFLIGYDYAMQDGPLQGFTEWLRLRTGSRRTRWDEIVRNEVELGSSSAGPPTESEHLEAIGGLKDLLHVFFYERDLRGVGEIFIQHAEKFPARETSQED